MTDQNTAAQNADDTQSAATGNVVTQDDGNSSTDGGAPVPTPEAAKSAKPKKVTSGVVWVQPGHVSYAVGQFVPCDPKTADKLRAQGYARVASAAEVELYTKSES